MYQQFYSQSDLLVWPVIATLIFVVIFAGVLAYVFLGLRDKDKIDRMASLPFDIDPDFEDQPAAASGDEPEGRARR